MCVTTHERQAKLEVRAQTAGETAARNDPAAQPEAQETQDIRPARSPRGDGPSVSTSELPVLLLVSGAGLTSATLAGQRNA